MKLNAFMPEFKAQYHNLFGQFNQKVPDDAPGAPDAPLSEMTDEELASFIFAAGVEIEAALALYGRERPEVDPEPTTTAPPEDDPPTE